MEFINRIQLLGMVGRIIVTKVANENIAKFSLVTEYSYKLNGEYVIDTTWFDVTAPEKTFGIDPKTIKKGDIVEVLGRVRIQRYRREDGTERFINEVVANMVQFITDKRELLKVDSEERKTDPDFSPAMLNHRIDEEHKFNELCMNKFIELVKETLKESGKKIIFIDPDSSIGCIVEHRHGQEGGDIHGISLSEEGNLRFRVSTQYDFLKDEPLCYECGYGVYIDSWAWALLVLQQHIQDPYEPEKEEVE